MTLDELLNLPYKVVDFETTNHNFGNAFDNRNYPVAVSLFSSRTGYLTAHFNSKKDQPILRQIREELGSDRYILVAHNAKFELHWLNKLGWDIEGALPYDTMFLPYLKLNGRIRKGALTLETLSKQKFPLGDMLVHKYGLNPATISPTLIKTYCQQDVEATVGLFEADRKWLTENRESDIYVRPLLLMLNALPVIVDMEHNGWCLDIEYLKELRQEEEAKQTELIKKLEQYICEQYGLEAFNCNSPKQISEFIYSKRLRKNKKFQWENFFEHYNPFQRDAESLLAENIQNCWEDLSSGLHITPIIRSLGKTQLSVDIDTLKLLIRENPKHKEIEVIKKFYEISRLNTLIGTFINGILGNTDRKRKKGERIKEPKYFLGSDGRHYLHTGYNQCVTATGRLSSSNPNLQNWPRKGTFPVRHSIRSRFPGGRISDSDASQIELRYAGWYYDDPVMRSDYEQGIDIHDENTRLAFGDSFTEEERSGTKETTFRVLYKGSARSIVADPKIPVWDLGTANLIVNTIYGKYKKLAAGQNEDIETVVFRDGELLTPTGRFYRIDVCEQCKIRWRQQQRTCDRHYGVKNKVANYPIQSGATADLMICAMIALHNALKCANLNSLLIGQVHDSFVIDTFPGEEEQVKSICEWALDEGARENWNYFFGFDFDFPLAAGFKIGETW